MCGYTRLAGEHQLAVRRPLMKLISGCIWAFSWLPCWVVSVEVSCEHRVFRRVPALQYLKHVQLVAATIGVDEGEPINDYPQHIPCSFNLESLHQQAMPLSGIGEHTGVCASLIGPVTAGGVTVVLGLCFC